VRLGSETDPDVIWTFVAQDLVNQMP